MNSLLSRICLAAASMAVICPTAPAALISDGLILNFQADNIDGQNNATLANGQEVLEWVDVIVPGGGADANNATVQGAVDYLVAGQGTPNYVAGPRPGVQFTETGANAGDALGFNTAINGLASAFTAVLVTDLNNTGPARSIQFGFRNASNHRIVGLANNGYRFNGGAQLFAESQFADGAHVVTYTMDLTQLYSAADYRFDGADGTNPATTGDQMLNLTNFNQGFVIGGGKNNTQAFIDPLDGVISALLVYNRVLSAEEVLEVEAFLTDKFAIPEASTLSLLAMGMAVCGWQRRRRVGTAV